MVNEQARKSHARERGRELALLAVCHLEGVDSEARTQALEGVWGTDSSSATGAEAVLAELVADSGARRYAQRLMKHLLDDWAEVDGTIEAISKKWRLERMDQIDRSVLRLATVELLREKTPRGVVVSEAVRLAARYGSERSPTFVNGIAESIAESVRADESTSSESASETHV